MRNLKRVLSLALALVMVLGMMVITTSAATYTDAEEITYTEAADVLSAIGVITGDNGYFAPDRALTREEGAALICYLLMGKETADKLVGSGAFADVKADRWSAGEIDYCANLGIIKGYTNAAGEQVFDPKEPLTGVAFGRMLLGALGYDGAIEGYTGGNWASAIMDDMIATGLDVRDVAMDAQLTREQAAQMALQALTKTLVKYTNPGTEIVLSDGTKVIVGASPASTKTWADFPGLTPVDYNGATGGTETGAGNSVQFCEKYFSNLAQSGDTVNGRSGFYWTVKGEEVSDFIVTDTVLKTVYGDGTTLAEMTDKTGKDYVGVQMDDGTPTTTYYLNGGTGASTDIEVKGAVAELIDTDRDGKCDKVCVVKKNVVTLTAAPSISTEKGKDYVTIPVCGVASKSVDSVIGYEGLKKDDVVLYVTMDDGTTIIEKAESFNGSVLGYKAGAQGGDLIGEDFYTASGLTGTTYTVNTIKDATAEYTFYVDNAGFIAKAVPVSAAAATNYAVVRDIVWVVPNTDGSIGAVSKSYAEAKLVFTDGTAQVVKIDSIDGYKLVAAGGKIADLASGATHYVSNTGAPVAATNLENGDSTTAVSTTTTTASDFYVVMKDTDTTIDATNTKTLGKFLAIEDAVVNGKTDVVAEIPVDTFYSYTVNADGSYALSTSMKRGETTDSIGGSAITNGKVAFDGSNVADDNTVFIYVTKNAARQDVYTVYTGIKNAPTTSAAASAGSVVEKTGTGVATYVYAVVAGTQDESRDIVYITDTNYTTVNAKTPYYIYDAVVNGVVTTIKADTSGLGVDFYKVDKVVDGVYTLNSTVANSADKTGVQSISGGILVTGDETAYTYTSGAPAYIIEKVGMKFVSTATTIDALTVDATDALFVLTKTVGANTNAETVYVVKANEAPAVLDLVNGTTNPVSISNSGDLTGLNTVAVTVSSAAMQVQVSATAATDTTIKGISINGVDVTASGTDYTLIKNGAQTVVVTVEDDFSKALTAYTYTFTVTGVPSV